MKKIIIALVLGCIVSIPFSKAQNSVIDLMLNENYDCQGKFYVDVLVKAADVSDLDFEIGTSSIFIEYNPLAIQLDRYYEESFEDASFDWAKQSMDVDPIYGSVNITLHREENGGGNFTLTKTDFIKVGTLHFDILDVLEDPTIRVKPSLTSFNSASPNDGLAQIDVLNFDQVHGRVNVALEGAVTQSSISGGWPAENAIDGSLDTWAQMQIFPNNWWYLDLGYEADIELINIIPRSVGTANRMPDYVFTSTSNIGPRTVAGNLANANVDIFPSADPSSVTVSHTINKKARYILIMKEDENYMAFKEVEVFTKEKSQLGGKATSSSVQSGFIAYNGHDQDFNSRVETNAEAEPYWTVDLGDYFRIDSIKIHPYEGSPSKMPDNLFVSDYPFQNTNIANTTADIRVASFATPGSSAIPVSVNMSDQGRYIRIQKSGVDNLIFKELEVFGCKLDCQAITDLEVSVLRACDGASNGSIIINFSEIVNPNRTNIEFSIDGGETFPHNLLLTDSDLIVPDLPTGTYDVWVRWGDDDCPTNLEDIVVGNATGPLVTVEAIHPCDGVNPEGSLEFSFPNDDGRTHLDFSIDGGLNYTTVSDSTVSYSFSSLAAGSYPIMVRWGNDECPIDFGNYTIDLIAEPVVSVSTISTCPGYNDGQIIFSFDDDPIQSTIELSINGGANFVSVNDADGSYVFTDLSEGSYAPMAQWTNALCTKILPDVMVDGTVLASATLSSSTDLCSSGAGQISFSFANHPTRTALGLSINGGSTYKNVSDTIGSYDFNNLISGTYNAWIRWGDGDCPTDLGDIIIDDICSSMYGKLFLDTNQDGVFQVGEPPLANIDILITMSDASTIITVTDIDGNYTADVIHGLTQVEYVESDPDFPTGAVLNSANNPELILVQEGENKFVGEVGYERCLEVAAEVLLEGALYNSSNTSYDIFMHTGMNQIGTLPGQTNVDALFGSTYFPAGQPYSVTPFNYNGTEGDQFDSNGDPANWDAGYPSNTVDWVLVSLRSGLNLTDRVCQAAALLMNDGTISFVEDFECCDQIDNSFYVVIEHRNHLIVMSANKVNVSNNKVNFDFISNDSWSDNFGLGSTQKLVTNVSNNDVYVMYAGNADMASGNVSDTDINVNDKVIWESENNMSTVYLNGDLDLSGDVNVNDRLLFDMNNNTFSTVPR